MAAGSHDLTGDDAIESGADFVKPWCFVEDVLDDADPGGRFVEDLVLTDGDSTATSATADFVSDDTDRKIATPDGLGIDDGTTMTVTNSTTIELSAPATATGTFKASLRALNCSAFTDHKAQVRNKPGGRLLCEFTVDDSRSDVGVFEFSLAGAATETLSGNGVYDWKVTGPDGVSYWTRGAVHIVKNATED